MHRQPWEFQRFRTWGHRFGFGMKARPRDVSAAGPGLRQSEAGEGLHLRPSVQAASEIITISHLCGLSSRAPATWRQEDGRPLTRRSLPPTAREW